MATENNTFMKRLLNLFSGEVFLNDYFTRQYKLLLLIVVLFMLYIANRYSMLEKIAEVDTLKKELEMVRYENTLYQADLMQESRQSHIKELVKSKQLDLQESLQPPYRLTVK